MAPPGGWSAAEIHCLPQVAVYAGGLFVLICVMFTVVVTAVLVRRAMKPPQ